MAENDNKKKSSQSEMKRARTQNRILYQKSINYPMYLKLISIFWLIIVREVFKSTPEMYLCNGELLFANKVIPYIYMFI